MDLALLDTLIRIAVPFLVGWNVFLFTQGQKNKDALSAHRLHVAEHYTRQEDLEKMLERLEQRLEKQLNNFLQTVTRGNER